MAISDEFYISYPADDGSNAYRLARSARIEAQKNNDFEAIRFSELAIEAAAELEDPSIEAWAHCLKAVSSAIVGLHEEGLVSGKKALQIAQEHDDNALQARALLSLGFVAIVANDDREVEKLLELSLEFAEVAKSDFDLFWALNNLSHVYCEQLERLLFDQTDQKWISKYEQLINTSQSALEVANRMGATLPQCYALLNLANAHYLNKDFECSNALIKRYQTLANENRDSRLMAYANLDQARLCGVKGDIESALAWIGSGTGHLDLCQSDDLKLRTHDTLVELHKAAKDFETACKHHESARKIERQINANRAGRHLEILTSQLEAQAANEKAARFKAETQALEMRNLFLEQDREILRQKAMLDPLTKLGNRRAAEIFFEAKISIAQAKGVLFQVVFIDLDHFKAVNDNYGHAVGDSVLVNVADILRKGTRPIDGVYRFGGEEFILLLNGPDLNSAMATCFRLRESILEMDWNEIASELKITASFGVAMWEGEDNQLGLLSRADRALYRAKDAGRNRIEQA